jgi:hypothetical protein
MRRLYPGSESGRADGMAAADIDKPINNHFEFCKRLQHSLNALPGGAHSSPAARLASLKPIT